MRNVAFGAGVALWSILVFFLTFYLTFPSDALVTRIEKEAPQLLGRDYEVDLASAAPWWVGVSMTDVAVSQRPRGRRGAEAEESSLVAFASKAWVRTSVFSLIRQTPYVTGAVRLGDGRVDFDVATRTGNRRPLEMSTLAVEADQLPLADLVGSPLVASSLGGFTRVGDGAVDLDVDLTAGERGMADGNGRVTITGDDLMLTDIASETTGPLGIDVPIRKLALVAEV
ncbi:MAG: type II secretion system protein GspN, partial [Myxococcota bacterium]